MTSFLSREPRAIRIQATVDIQVGVDSPRYSPGRNITPFRNRKRSRASLTFLIPLGSIRSFDELSGGHVFQRTRGGSSGYPSGSRDGAGEGLLEEEHRGDEDEDERACGPHGVWGSVVDVEEERGGKRIRGGEREREMEEEEEREGGGRVASVRVWLVASDNGEEVTS